MLLFALIQSASIEVNALNKDSSVLSDETFKSENSIAEVKITKEPIFLEPEESFIFRIDGSEINEIFYNRTEYIAEISTRLKHVGSLIANEIKFQVPIIVDVKLTYLPHSIAITNSTRKYAGQKLFPNGTAGKRLAYPIGVVKQSKTVLYRLMHKKLANETRSIIYEYLEADFEISFNCRTNWNHQKSSLEDPTTDFDLIAAHQITIGLGFDTNLIQYSGSQRGYSFQSRGINHIGPKLLFDADTNSLNMSYMSPLDNLMYGKPPTNLAQALLSIFYMQSESKLAPISETFGQFASINIFSRNFLQSEFSLLEKLRFHWIGESLTSIFDARRVEAWFDDGKVLKLDPTYSNIGLVHQDLWRTNDFLMTAFVKETKVLELNDLMRRFNDGKLYGDLTLKVLEEVGYSTYRKPMGIEFA